MKLTGCDICQKVPAKSYGISIGPGQNPVGELDCPDTEDYFDLCDDCFRKYCGDALSHLDYRYGQQLSDRLTKIMDKRSKAVR